MPDIAGILDSIAPRELPVAVCLAGDLAGQADRLQAELAACGEDWAPAHMGDVDPRRTLAAALDDVRARMREATVTFTFRALGHIPYSGLIAAHPAPQGSDDAYDSATFLPALLAACCTDPVMTPQQVKVLLGQLNDGQARQLFAAALAVNEEPSPLPF